MAHTSPVCWDHIASSGDFLWDRATGEVITGSMLRDICRVEALVEICSQGKPSLSSITPSSDGFNFQRPYSGMIANPAIECYEKRLSRKEGCAMNTFFRHHRQRGPVNALQMRLQG
jgi:hypothetical protein